MPPLSQSAPAASAKKSGPILVVEDDAFLRGLLIDKMKKEGYEVQEAQNGADALEAIKKSRPALILLDLIMPGMDGFQFLEEARKTKEAEGLPVLVLSNLGEPEQIARAKSLGAKDHLVKAHMFLDEIVEKVASMLQ